MNKLTDTENELLKYIDIKYFKNNPEYIRLWQEYFYNNNKDIKILFLMKFKKVSIDYHWIYIELSKFFIKKNKPEISIFLLQDALKNEVYNSEEILNELNKYQTIKPIDYNEAYRYLNPVGFYLFDRFWNEYKIETFYDQNIYNCEISFEEYRLKNYKYKNIEKKTNDQINLWRENRNILKSIILDEDVKKFKYNFESEILSPIDDYDIENDIFIYMINLLKNSPDLVKLFFLEKFIENIITTKIICEDVTKYYIDKNLKIKLKKDAICIKYEETDFKNIILLLRDYIEIEAYENLSSLVFINKIKNIIKCYDIKRALYKFEISIYEKKLANLN